MKKKDTQAISFYTELGNLKRKTENIQFKTLIDKQSTFTTYVYI